MTTWVLPAVLFFFLVREGEWTEGMPEESTMEADRRHVPCLLPIAPYCIKNKHIVTVCILLTLWYSRHWQTAERAALSLNYQKPSRDSLMDQDLWSFHLERLAVPICLMVYTVL